jgi:hypothetical protein
MLYSYRPDPEQIIRHRCRNPRCAGRLEKRTENRRDAFCCESCERAFFRVRCRVCEALISRKTARRAVCWRPTCRYQYKRHPEQFFGTRYPSGPMAHNGEKKPAKSTPKITTFSGRPFRVEAGPEPRAINLRIPPELPLSRANKAFQDHWQNAKRRADHLALIKRDTPPVNIVGGYRFQDAPAIDLGGPVVTPSPAQPAKPKIGGDPFDIPAFLKRTGG